MAEKISVIVPAYNEGRHIVLSLHEIVETMESFNRPYEIVVMDDGSTDGTYKMAQEVAEKFSQIFVKRNRTNFGKGRTLKKGFRYATGDLIVFCDADLDLHPQQLRRFFKIMEDERVDVVIGSKRHPESRVEYPWHRRIVSAAYFLLVKILFGLPIRDTQTGLKVFKRKVLKEVFPVVLVKRYAYDLEVLVLAHHFGYSVAEAPVELNFQRGFFGRVGLNSIINTWWDTMAIFYRMKIMRYYDKSKE